MQTVKLLSRLATTMAVGLALCGATPALAAGPVQTSGSKVPSPDRATWQKGLAAWKSGDHVGAGFQWSQTLQAIPENRRNVGLRMRLVLDTMESYRRAYDTTGDAQHLQSAMDAYYGYFSAWETAYGHPGIPRQVVAARHTIKEALEQEQEQPPVAASPAPGSETSPNPATDSSTTDTDTVSDTSTRPAADPAESSTEVETSSGSVATAPNGDGTDPAGTSSPPPVVSVNASTSSTDRPSTPLLVTGAALIAVGAGAGSMIAVGAIQGGRARDDQKRPGYDDDQRDRIDSQGRTMNAVMIAGLVATPVLLGAGAALVVVGAKRRRQAKTASLSPMLGRGMAGLTIRGRF